MSQQDFLDCMQKRAQHRQKYSTATTPISFLYSWMVLQAVIQSAASAAFPEGIWKPCSSRQLVQPPWDSQIRGAPGRRPRMWTAGDGALPCKSQVGEWSWRAVLGRQGGFCALIILLHAFIMLLLCPYSSNLVVIYAPHKLTQNIG